MNKKITIALCIFLTLTIVFYYVTQSSYVYANMNVDDAVTLANEMDKDIGTTRSP